MSTVISEEPPRSEQKVKMNYPSNSHRERDAKEEPTTTRPKMEKVVSGNVSERKKPLGTRIAENFGGEDLKSVGSHVFFNVLLPSAKDMMYDAVKEGFARAIFGDGARPRSSNSNTPRGGAFTNYSGYSKTKNERPANAAPAGKDDDFQDIVFQDRGDAEAVLDQLVMLIEEYGSATVADLYECAGKTGPFTAAKYGWSNLSSARVDRERGGYYLNLPKAKWIE